jgi:hypothetical protein
MPFTFAGLYPVISTVDYAVQIEYYLADTTCGVRGMRATAEPPRYNSITTEVARMLLSDKHRVRAFMLLALYGFLIKIWF